MPTRWSLPGFLCLLVVALLGGCSLQGEGDRCDPLSGGNPPGSADCQSGLTCSRMGMSYVCCPANGQGTAAACTANAQFADASTSPAAEDAASGVDDGGADAPTSGPGADAAEASTPLVDGGGAEAAAQ